MSALVRRAGGGERIIIAIDGQPVAQLGPLGPDHAGFTLDDLAAAGLIHTPRREPPTKIGPPRSVPADVDLDRLIDQVRGR